LSMPVEYNKAAEPLLMRVATRKLRPEQNKRTPAGVLKENFAR
jgi:hypothetical protein